MKTIPIGVARELGKQSDARRVVIIALDDDGYGITTWGKTKKLCRELAAWAESDIALGVVETIAEPDSGRGEAKVVTIPYKEIREICQAAINLREKGWSPPNRTTGVQTGGREACVEGFGFVTISAEWLLDLLGNVPRSGESHNGTSSKG